MTEEPLDSVLAPKGADDPSPRRSRAALILTVMLAVVVVIAVFTPQPNDVGERYTTRSTGPFGARIVYDLASRLGWKVQRRTTAQPPPASPHMVNVVIEPQEELDATEVHALLENARAGGGLLVAGDVKGVADSVGYFLRGGGELNPASSDNAGCDTHTDPMAINVGPPPTADGIVWRRPPPSTPVVFASISVDNQGSRPAFIGVALGLGRVVIAGSGEPFRNDVVRRCRFATDVIFVRALEYLHDGGGAPTFLVFDEFHHGDGAHPGSFQAIANYATETQSGHTLLQAAIAGLLLLIAAAPRVIAPRPPDRAPRRSPLEHADALAHAYEGVKATRTVAMRLLGGVRRRAGLSRAGQNLDDEGFLTLVAGSWPKVATDAEIVRRALRQQIPAGELTAVAEALLRIESALTLPRGSQSETAPRLPNTPEIPSL